MGRKYIIRPLDFGGIKQLAQQTHSLASYSLATIAIAVIASYGREVYNMPADHISNICSYCC